MPEQTSDKEQGEKCLNIFEETTAKLNGMVTAMVTALNTLPLVLLPVTSTRRGDGFVIAVQLDKGVFSPIALLETHDELKEQIEAVHYEGEYKLVKPTGVPGFEAYSNGEAWNDKKAH